MPSIFVSIHPLPCGSGLIPPGSAGKIGFGVLAWEKCAAAECGEKKKAGFDVMELLMGILIRLGSAGRSRPRRKPAQRGPECSLA